MTRAASESVDQTTDQVIAEGVDDEPVETNRRQFSGQLQLVIAAIATLYAAFHMIALNGVSLSDMTGIEIPFLPTFPIETWNFRIVHIAGALGVGFLAFPPRPSLTTHHRRAARA